MSTSVEHLVRPLTSGPFGQFVVEKRELDTGDLLDTYGPYTCELTARLAAEARQAAADVEPEECAICGAEIPTPETLRCPSCSASTVPETRERECRNITAIHEARAREARAAGIEVNSPRYGTEIRRGNAIVFLQGSDDDTFCDAVENLFTAAQYISRDDAELSVALDYEDVLYED